MNAERLYPTKELESDPNFMKETAQAFEVHREPVSRIVKKMNLNV